MMISFISGKKLSKPTCVKSNSPCPALSTSVILESITNNVQDFGTSVNHSQSHYPQTEKTQKTSGPSQDWLAYQNYSSTFGWNCFNPTIGFRKQQVEKYGLGLVIPPFTQNSRLNFVDF